MAEQSRTVSPQHGQQRSQTPQQAGQSPQSGTRDRSMTQGRQANQNRTVGPWRGGSDLWFSRPFELMDRMRDEMDRMFADFGFGRPRSSRPAFDTQSGIATTWSPRIEAFQEGDRFIVRAELPGMKKEDVEVNLSDDAITIQGERRQEERDTREGYYHSECSYGSFFRSIPLPEGVIADSADASFKDGVLEIRMQAPPHEVSRGRRIEVKDGGAQQGR